MHDFSQFLQSAVTDICRTDSWDNYKKAIKSKKKLQAEDLLHLLPATLIFYTEVIISLT